MGLVGVVYKTSKIAYKTYRNYERIKRVFKTGEVIYNGSKDMYNKIKHINNYKYNQDLDLSKSDGVTNDSSTPNNMVQYPVKEDTPIISKDTLMKGLDLITWIV